MTAATHTRPGENVETSTAAKPRRDRIVTLHMFSRASFNMHKQFGLPLISYCRREVFIRPGGYKSLTADCAECIVLFARTMDVLRNDFDVLDWHPEFLDDDEAVSA